MKKNASRSLTWGLAVFISVLMLFFSILVFPIQAEESKKFFLYDPNKTSADRVGNFLLHLDTVGFTEIMVGTGLSELEKALVSNVDVALIHVDRTSLFPPDTFMSARAKPYVERGGLLIISSSRDLPLDSWFGPETRIKRIPGDGQSELRRTEWVDEGSWVREPHTLVDAVWNQTAPDTTYQPLSDTWEVLATRKRTPNDPNEVRPYLLRQSFGEGALVVTTSGMGLINGWEIFGHQRANNTAKLVDNLLAALRESGEAD